MDRRVWRGARGRRRGVNGAAGFSLVELVATVALIGVLSALAMAPMFGYMRRSRSFAASREVGAQIRSARLAAVTANRTMRIRFNCPAASQYRVIEWTNNPAIDAAANRCAFPFPDPAPGVAPNLDGPIQQLPDGIVFGATQDLSISPTGVVTALSGAMPAVLVIRDGVEDDRQVTVSTGGRVQTP